MHIQGMKIIRKVVECRNIKSSAPASEWDTDDWIIAKTAIETE